MPRGIPNKPKTKKAPAKKKSKIIKAAAKSTGRKVKDVKLKKTGKEFFAGLPSEGGPQKFLEELTTTEAAQHDDVVDVAAVASLDTRISNQAQAYAYSGNLAGGLMQRLTFVDISPAEQRQYAIDNTRRNVRETAYAMANATSAVNTCKNAADVPVLRAKAELARAEFDRAVSAFEEQLKA